jgi:hypothetical protein
MRAGDSNLPSTSFVHDKRPHRRAVGIHEDLTHRLAEFLGRLWAIIWTEEGKDSTHRLPRDFPHVDPKLFVSFLGPKKILVELGLLTGGHWL